MEPHVQFRPGGSLSNMKRAISHEEHIRLHPKQLDHESSPKRSLLSVFGVIYLMDSIHYESYALAGILQNLQAGQSIHNSREIK